MTRLLLSSDQIRVRPEESGAGDVSLPAVEFSMHVSGRWLVTSTSLQFEEGGAAECRTNAVCCVIPVVLAGALHRAVRHKGFVRVRNQGGSIKSSWVELRMYLHVEVVPETSRKKVTYQRQPRIRPLAQPCHGHDDIGAHVHTPPPEHVQSLLHI